MKFVASIVGGVVVALLLFLLMHTLITGGKQITRSDADGKVVDFIRVREEEMVNLKRRQPPKKPPPPKNPPPPPKIKLANQDKPPPTPLDIETPDIELSAAAGGGPFLGNWSAGDPAAEGDVIPIVRIDPQWPREALIEGIEGYVFVEFTITTDGSVKDVQVLEAEPRRLFNRNAIRAILKWKFKPRIVDGAAVERRATQRIDFKLDG